MKKKNAIIFSFALFIVFLDHLTKWLIRKNLHLNHSVPLINNFLSLTYITNNGSAFGLFKGFNLFFIFFSIVVIGLILYFIRKIKENERLLQFLAGLLLGGTLGNLFDRLVYGSVIDFIDFRIWPVFNVADSAVTISVILLVLVLWKK